MKHEYDVEIGADDRRVGSGEDPVFSAYEASDSRVPGLAGAYGFARATVAQMSVRYQNAFDGAVVAMHDHKGTLEITWRDHEARVVFEGVMAGAWENSAEHMMLHRLAEKS